MPRLGGFNVTIKSGRFECVKCQRNFNTFKLLQLHEKVVHNTDGIIECRFCHGMFHDERSYETHVDRNHITIVKNQHDKRRVLSGDFD